jgi:hypothetical protein
MKSLTSVLAFFLASLVAPAVSGQTLTPQEIAIFNKIEKDTRPQVVEWRNEVNNYLPAYPAPKDSPYGIQFLQPISNLLKIQLLTPEERRELMDHLASYVDLQDSRLKYEIRIKYQTIRSVTPNYSVDRSGGAGIVMIPGGVSNFYFLLERELRAPNLNYSARQGALAELHLLFKALESLGQIAQGNKPAAAIAKSDLFATLRYRKDMLEKTDVRLAEIGTNIGQAVGETTEKSQLYEALQNNDIYRRYYSGLSVEVIKKRIADLPKEPWDLVYNSIDRFRQELTSAARQFKPASRGGDINELPAFKAFTNQIESFFEVTLLNHPLTLPQGMELKPVTKNRLWYGEEVHDYHFDKSPRYNRLEKIVKANTLLVPQYAGDSYKSIWMTCAEVLKDDSNASASPAP